ncbi:DUF3775 domain-containing protein [Limoniibacter endophyticus]|uniref:DUF3775 domain-containing protein n=1 Tax=Limoniibacter endophyticus TaxID=1565040 RepID=A0A8J3GGM9_9HYPH|nr:DUF3775 domain-containing protein [Limoniibacter endophyticus]GHC65842.1 hypothetical protein GCM10010136_08860 [Limoniibacter endophyticus]
MQKQDREFELSLKTDEIRDLILKARAVGAELRSDFDAGYEHDTEVDDDFHETHRHDGLAEEEQDDLRASELRGLISDLNVDQRLELLAIVWIGRGDFTPDEWEDALVEARRRNLRRIPDYLLSLPMLDDHLEAGLEAIGA